MLDQIEIFAEIARLESELEDKSLTPEQIKAKKAELEDLRQQNNNL